MARKYNSADDHILNDDDYAAMQQLKDRWSTADQAGDQAGKDAAHREAEGIRSKYNYSGGGDGTQYNAIKAPAPAQYSAPKSSYVSPYSAQVDQLLGELMGGPNFSYNHETDPRYQQYEKEYTRLGQRAMQDTLGQVSARTGGLASSYATTAASQANEEYMAALASKIPELEQLAYSMYMDQRNDKRANLSTLMGLDDTAYGRWSDQWGRDYQTGRDQVADQRYNNEWTYQTGRDRIEDQKYMNEFDYKKEQDAMERAYRDDSDAFDRALQKWDRTGVLDEKGAEVLGLPAGTKNTDYQYQLAQLARSASSGKGGRTDGYQDYEGLYAGAWASQNAENFISSNYKKYGFTSPTGLSKGYTQWKTSQADNGQKLYDKGTFETLVAYTRKCIEKAGRSPEYMYDALRVQGYSDEVIDQCFAALGL